MAKKDKVQPDKEKKVVTKKIENRPDIDQKTGRKIHENDDNTEDSDDEFLPRMHPNK